MIDAAGNIYLMGGYLPGGGPGQFTFYNDVWVGTNNGANPTQCQLRGTHRVLIGPSRGTCSKGGKGYSNGHLGATTEWNTRTRTRTSARAHTKVCM